MKIFGLDIRRAKDIKIPENQDFEDFVGDCIIKCNNQLRGIVNEKAIGYNAETLEYWFAKVMEKSIYLGMELEKKKELNKKINS